MTVQQQRMIEILRELGPEATDRLYGAAASIAGTQPAGEFRPAAPVSSYYHLADTIPC